ncbi:Hypothetical predicted protein, partial [Paramuricea clavata]
MDKFENGSDTFWNWEKSSAFDLEVSETIKNTTWEDLLNGTTPSPQQQQHFQGRFKGEDFCRERRTWGGWLILLKECRSLWIIDNPAATPSQRLSPLSFARSFLLVPRGRDAATVQGQGVELYMDAARQLEARLKQYLSAPSPWLFLLAEDLNELKQFGCIEVWGQLSKKLSKKIYPQDALVSNVTPPSPTGLASVTRTVGPSNIKQANT